MDRAKRGTRGGGRRANGAYAHEDASQEDKTDQTRHGDHLPATRRPATSGPGSRIPTRGGQTGRAPAYARMPRDGGSGACSHCARRRQEVMPIYHKRPPLSMRQRGRRMKWQRIPLIQVGEAVDGEQPVQECRRGNASREPSGGADAPEQQGAMKPVASPPLVAPSIAYDAMTSPAHERVTTAALAPRQDSRWFPVRRQDSRWFPVRS